MPPSQLVHLAGRLHGEDEAGHVEERAVGGLRVRALSVDWLQPLTAPTIIVA